MRSKSPELMSEIKKYIEDSTRFHAIRLSKYNCSVRVEDEYHTEHGQAALHRDFNFDSPVTQ